MPADTKNIIMDTYLSMVRDKGNDKITVKALIEECGVSRQTFYYHFQDIMDVIECLVKRENERILAGSLKAENPEDALCMLISSAVENRDMARMLLNTQKRERTEEIFFQGAKSYIQEMIRHNPKQISLGYSELEVALDFCAMGICGTMFRCCLSNEEIDAHKMARLLYRLLTGKI